MTTVIIKNIAVKFPFTPYVIQTEYMSKVIECLEGEQNGVLESPTGTGKTLCLLCATLGWLEHRKKLCQSPGNTLTVPKIIYSSRTHTQLLQAMQELKKTEYNYMKACILGSREQMCIDPEVMTEPDASQKLTMCRNKVKRRKDKCCFYQNVEKNRNNKELCASSVLDIEDLVKLGKKHDFCPYYMARELRDNSDIIFMPYNYLLDPRIRQNMNVQFENDVIIFDEAHNIEKICEEAVSVQMKSTYITSAIESVQQVIELLTENSQFSQIEEEEIKFDEPMLLMLEEMLKKLLNEINAIPLRPLALQGTVFDGDKMFEIFSKALICEDNSSGVIDLINNIVEFLGLAKHKINPQGLKVVKNFIFMLFVKKGEDFREKIKRCFKVQIEEEKQQRRSSVNMDGIVRILNFWCFCPGFGMHLLSDRNLHSIILTSGTLAPLNPLISELELEVGVKIENPHIVNPEQICVRILSSGPDSEKLTGTYNNRNNMQYVHSLGLVISNLIRQIPDGVLIFFASYTQMEKTVKEWKNYGIWNSINKTKPIFVEPKDKTSFNKAMNDYYQKVKDPNYKGAIFMGVCRGKVSEGLDFADINGRAVFIIGLPYPPLKDPKIILKQEYLDLRHAQDKEYLSGSDWYVLEATRAINQAIGRVIRHKNDYGAIILLDARFNEHRVKNNLSLWLRQHIIHVHTFPEITTHLKTFFKNAEERAQALITSNVMKLAVSSPVKNSRKCEDSDSSSSGSPWKRNR